MNLLLFLLPCLPSFFIQSPFFVTVLDEVVPVFVVIIDPTVVIPGPFTDIKVIVSWKTKQGKIGIPYAVA